MRLRKIISDASRIETLALLVALGLLCGIAAPAVALPTPYLEAYASASDSGAGPDTQSTSSGYVFASRSGSYSGFGISRGADASAGASFGMLQAKSSASGTQGAGVSGAAARFRDSLVITAPGIATGTPGVFEFAVEIEGGMDAQNGIADWIFKYQVAGFGWQTGAEGRVWQDPGGAGVEGDPFGGDYASGLWIFRFGEPFTLELLLGTDTTAGRSNASGSAFSNFSNTLAWQGILRVEDPYSHAAISGYSVSSASGTDYSQPIPEPATLLLLASGLLGLSWRAWRHGRPA